MKTFHLLSNAHLDPVWLWEWEEGAAEAISTFRVAADLCEEFNGFIFNHNEVTLYKWVEEYEPVLFARIQELVKQGKWNIMGGWYLQPDCNMPSGESFVRQMLLGRNYFQEKFGVKPTTAINFDPFGHTRGLVQIMNKAGFDSYIFCRPTQKDCELPDHDFVWVGYDGSEIIGHRADEFYNSPRGKADEKVREWIEKTADQPIGSVLWGVGNHGGGPSREDLHKLKLLMAETKDVQIIHSIPEAFFKELRVVKENLHRHEKDINAWAPGCYTSQIRIKQKHRLLENEIYMLEKMMSHTSLQGLIAYPYDLIHEALCDLMVTEFHDVLPGSSIQPVEEASLRLVDHGLEIISRLKARAFFALANGQKKAEEGEIPILIYNPHPYKVSGIFECEFQLADQNWKDEFSLPLVYKDGVQIASQAEKELSNLNLDWRKRAVFQADLEPGQMNRFDVRLEVLPKKPVPALQPQDGKINFLTEELEVIINCETGLIDRYRANGMDYVQPNAFVPIVIDDNDDPWETQALSFRNVEGAFKLMSAEEGTRFSGIRGSRLESVRVIEDGAVRTVVETLFEYGDSFIIQTYKLPKKGTEIEVQIRVHWNEKSKMLKLSIPTVFAEGRYWGQVAYGRNELPSNGNEAVSQKWLAVIDEKQDLALTCINDGVYGSDYLDGEMRISLLRSAGYSGHPIEDRPIMAQDRYSSRIDQGERLYRFWFNGGKASQRMDLIDREALSWNEKPFVLSFFPSGAGALPENAISLSDSTILLTAFKRAELSDDFIIRLFEPTGEARVTTITIPALGIKQEIELGKFEIKTLKVNTTSKEITEASLME
ncbi:alpha-mannosidase [Paenibacillus baekrokdamisoli]|uniref:Alpha-mannosidase n=1 Tax=Paenibacillus baekrokdamisoli TaxID=1712516 RepID=A0A3G9IZU3_9BACL|nr:alpha-mannosidase [Paenibacillus baekrokdamisoli]MBB3067653.1 alpha-mannosidase [Paenibacillus baekrokdamisoli]BBH19161.1 alpha-mannosidase [Paenibacillus baekrokdamisoli]